MSSIPRSLPLSILEELSILFSDYFVNQIKTDDKYNLLNQIEWGRYSDDLNKNTINYPLFPTFITPERIFTDAHVVWKDILLKWENLNSSRQNLISDFLQQLYQTSLFHIVFDHLSSRDVFTGDRKDFEDYFHQVWFGKYKWDQMSTSTKTNTCGFQHVYIGENHRSKIKGLHYWKRYYILEKTGRLHLNKIHKIHPNLHITSMKFQVDNAVKPYGTIFFGLPMDYEMLIFFCAFLVGPNRSVNFIIDGVLTMVICYDVATQSNALATAYFKY